MKEGEAEKNERGEVIVDKKKEKKKEWDRRGESTR
jgi:hypothetical protein